MVGTVTIWNPRKTSMLLVPTLQPKHFGACALGKKAERLRVTYGEAVEALEMRGTARD